MKRPEQLRFRRLRQTLRQIFREWDPVGLIAGGAPADEYDPEIGTLLVLLGKVSESEFPAAWESDLNHWFTQRPWPGLDAAAAQIWRAWQLFQEAPA